MHGLGLLLTPHCTKNIEILTVKILFNVPLPSTTNSWLIYRASIQYKSKCDQVYHSFLPSFLHKYNPESLHLMPKRLSKLHISIMTN